MKKNILVLTGSPRKDGNSEKLADAFILGANEVGHDVTKIRTANLKIHGCLDCKQCFSHDAPCCIDDDFNARIAPELEKADVLVLVTPLYWFTYTAQLKLVLDKMYAYMRKKDALNIKQAILLVCGGGTNEEFYTGIEKSFDFMCKFMKCENSGVVIADGLHKKDSILSSQQLVKAKNLGREI